MRILDQELRLVTPTDPHGQLEEDEDDAPGEHASVEHAPREHASGEPRGGRYYQLTHDYLVPSVRRWLVRKQKETRRGRAELLLEEKAAVWAHRPQERYLPSLVQWLRIRALTRRDEWTAPERAMMRAAGRRHALRGFFATVCAVLLGWGSFEGFGYVKSRTLLDQLVYADTADVPAVVADLGPYRRWAEALDSRPLRGGAGRFVGPAGTAGWPCWPGTPTRWSSSSSAPWPWIMRLFARCRRADSACRRADRKAVAGPRRPGDRCDAAAPGRHAAGPFRPPEPESSGRWQKNADFLARQLHAATLGEPDRFNDLVSTFGSVGPLLVGPLRELSRDPRRTEAERTIAVNWLLEYAGHNREVMADIVLSDPDPGRAAKALEKLVAAQDEALALLRPELAGRPEALSADWQDARLASFQSPDGQAVQRIEAAGGMVSERFALCQTMPLEEFLAVAEKLRPAGYRPIRFRPYRAAHVVASLRDATASLGETRPRAGVLVAGLSAHRRPCLGARLGTDRRGNARAGPG